MILFLYADHGVARTFSQFSQSSWLKAHLFIQRTRVGSRASGLSVETNHAARILKEHFIHTPSISSFCSTPPPIWTPAPATLTGIRLNPCATPLLEGQSGHLADPLQKQFSKDSRLAPVQLSGCATCLLELDKKTPTFSKVPTILAVMGGDGTCGKFDVSYCKHDCCVTERQLQDSLTGTRAPADECCHALQCRRVLHPSQSQWSREGSVQDGSRAS